MFFPLKNPWILLHIWIENSEDSLSGGNLDFGLESSLVMGKKMQLMAVSWVPGKNTTGKPTSVIYIGTIWGLGIVCFLFQVRGVWSYIMTFNWLNDTDVFFWCRVLKLAFLCQCQSHRVARCRCFFKCLESVEVLTRNPSVMVITLPATDFDDPSRCRKCKCHLPHELVAQKWCHFLVRRLRNTQVTTWVRIFLDANQARRPRSKTLPMIHQEMMSFFRYQKVFLRLAIPKCFTGVFLSQGNFQSNILKTKSQSKPTPSDDLDEPKPQGRDWNLEPMVQVQKGCVGGRTWMVENIRDLAGEVFY